MQHYPAVSIIGNAKNAGKTTVLNALIGHIKKPVVLTSIGLDGEALDQVTFLEKPSIHVRQGDYVLTAKETLTQFTATYKLHFRSSFMTPLGPIVLCEIMTPGTALVAGPSLVSELKELLAVTQEKVPYQIFIDGAFFRQSFVPLTKACLFVVGANDSPQMEETIERAFYIYQKLTLPKTQLLEVSLEPFITLFSPRGKKVLPFQTLIGNEKAVFDALDSDTETLYIPQALNDAFIDRWVQFYPERQLHLIVQDGTHIQLKTEQLKHVFKLASSISVVEPIMVLGVCINPYSPRGYTYPASDFKALLSEKLGRNVINVKEVF